MNYLVHPLTNIEDTSSNKSTLVEVFQHLPLLMVDIPKTIVYVISTPHEMDSILLEESP